MAYQTYQTETAPTEALATERDRWAPLWFERIAAAVVRLWMAQAEKVLRKGGHLPDDT